MTVSLRQIALLLPSLLPTRTSLPLRLPERWAAEEKETRSRLSLQNEAAGLRVAVIVTARCGSTAKTLEP